MYWSFWRCGHFGCAGSCFGYNRFSSETWFDAEKPLLAWKNNLTRHFPFVESTFASVKILLLLHSRAPLIGPISRVEKSFNSIKQFTYQHFLWLSKLLFGNMKGFRRGLRLLDMFYALIQTQSFSVFMKQNGKTEKQLALFRQYPSGVFHNDYKYCVLPACLPACQHTHTDITTHNIRYTYAIKPSTVQGHKNCSVHS